MMTDEQLLKSMELTKINKEYDYKFDHVDATDKNGKFSMEKFIKETEKIREKYKEDYIKPITELSVEILGNKSIDDSDIQMLIHDTSKSEWAKKLKADSVDKSIIEKSGFKANKYGGFEKKLSNGADLTIEADPGIMPGKNILMAASDYEKNQKSHDKVVLDAVRKELSNRMYFDLDDKQLDDVMSKLKPAGVSMQEFNGHVIGEISFFDPTYTNHWFDTEYDFTKKKASYVTMNG
jgi:phenylpyruvate tautomerase PptA (4-oxalocrotonate tautomerase family)